MKRAVRRLYTCWWALLPWARLLVAVDLLVLAWRLLRPMAAVPTAAANPSRPLWAGLGTGTTLACGVAVFVLLAGAGLSGLDCGLGVIALGWAWR